MGMARVCDCPPNQRGPGGLWVHWPTCEHFRGEVTVEALRGQCFDLRAERDAAVAEMRRLTAKWGALEAERDGMRGALERIRDSDNCHCYHPADPLEHHAQRCLRKMAAAALGPTPITATGACGRCDGSGTEGSAPSGPGKMRIKLKEPTK